MRDPLNVLVSSLQRAEDSKLGDYVAVAPRYRRRCLPYERDVCEAELIVGAFPVGAGACPCHPGDQRRCGSTDQRNNDAHAHTFSRRTAFTQSRISTPSGQRERPLFSLTANVCCGSEALGRN